MALIYCPKCSRSSADAIDQCPNCGAALGKHSPPATSLQAESDLNNDQGAQPPFFAVSLLKLIVLSICTFGLYEIYWFWRNWNRIRVSGEPDITPSLRALFLIFYCYPCFFRIKQSGISHGVTPAPPIGILAICYVLMTFSWRLPGPAGLIAFLSVAFLLPVQAYVNRIYAAVSPRHHRNARFGVWNWVAVFVGGLLFILAVIGSIYPKQSLDAPSGNRAALGARLGGIAPPGYSSLSSQLRSQSLSS